MKTILSREQFIQKRGVFLGSLRLILLGLMVAGCSPSNPPVDAPSATPSGKITVRGSNTFGEELAPNLIAEYKKAHPSASFDLETKATSYGFGALMGGFCDIAGASRLPSKEELEVAVFRHVELNDHVIGTYSVAVVVNEKNPVGNLTKEQVRDVFTGAVTNWSAVGGPDAPIHIFVRDPVSGTSLGFKELAMENKAYGLEQNLFTNYAAIVAAVAQDENGIGYASIEQEKNPGVKPVSIGGVEPSVASVNKGEYPYSRVLIFTPARETKRRRRLSSLSLSSRPPGKRFWRRLALCRVPELAFRFLIVVPGKFF